MAAIATPSRQRRTGSRRGRRLKLFRKTTFLVNDGGGGSQAYGSDQDQEVETNRKSYAHAQVTATPSPIDDNRNLRIVQFSQETALSKSIRRKAKSEGKANEYSIISLASYME